MEKESFNSPESSNIQSAAYYPTESRLVIAFHKGQVRTAVYEYPGVSRDIWEGFRNAPSRGAYFAQHIRKLAGRRLAESEW